MLGSSGNFLWIIKEKRESEEAIPAADCVGQGPDRHTADADKPLGTG